MIGRPQLYIPITVNNPGEKVFYIDSFICELTFPDHKIIKITALSAISNAISSTVQAPLESNIDSTPILPEGRWSKTLNCINLPNATDKGKIQFIMDGVNQFVESHIQKSVSIGVQPAPILVPEKYVNPAIKMFDEIFRLCLADINYR